MLNFTWKDSISGGSMLVIILSGVAFERFSEHQLSVAIVGVVATAVF